MRGGGTICVDHEFAKRTHLVGGRWLLEIRFLANLVHDKLPNHNQRYEATDEWIRSRIRLNTCNYLLTCTLDFSLIGCRTNHETSLSSERIANDRCSFQK